MFVFKTAIDILRGNVVQIPPDEILDSLNTQLKTARNQVQLLRNSVESYAAAMINMTKCGLELGKTASEYNIYVKNNGEIEFPRQEEFQIHQDSVTLFNESFNKIDQATKSIYQDKFTNKLLAVFDELEKGFIKEQQNLEKAEVARRHVSNLEHRLTKIQTDIKEKTQKGKNVVDEKQFQTTQEDKLRRQKQNYINMRLQISKRIKKICDKAHFYLVNQYLGWIIESQINFSQQLQEPSEMLNKAQVLTPYRNEQVGELKEVPLDDDEMESTMMLTETTENQLNEKDQQPQVNNKKNKREIKKQRPQQTQQPQPQKQEPKERKQQPQKNCKEQST